MKKIIILLFISSNVLSQSIVNTELKKSYNDKKIFAEIEGTLDMQKGNAEIFQFESSIILGYNLNTKNLIKFMFGHTQLSENQEAIDNDSYGQIRHNYKFSELIKSFVFLQYQENLSLLLTERFIFGGGVRYDTKIKKIDFGIGSGVMYENEILFDENLFQGEENNITTIRMAGLSSFKLPLSNEESILILDI